MPKILNRYEATEAARKDIIDKAFCSGETRLFNEDDVRIEMYRELGYAIVQVDREYKIEKIEDKTLLDMLEIAIQMKKAPVEEQV